MHMTKINAREHSILHAAAGLIDQEGIEQLSMRKLAAEIDYSTFVLYQHFSNKHALLQELFDLVCLELVQHLELRAISGDPLETFKDTIREDIYFMLERPHRVDLFLYFIPTTVGQHFPKGMEKVVELFQKRLSDLRLVTLMEKTKLDKALDVLRTFLTGVLTLGRTSTGKNRDAINATLSEGINVLINGWS